MSRRGFRAALAVSLALALVIPQPFGKSAWAREPQPPVLQAQGSLQAMFSPWDDIEGRLVELINGARQQVLVQAYLLTNRKISRSLVAAHKRGVDVQILADAKQHARVKSSKLPVLAAAGVDIWLENQYQSAHNKVIIIDAARARSTVVTGSFNFTWSAQHRNAENVLILRNNPPLTARYAQNWERHKRDATPYRP